MKLTELMQFKLPADIVAKITGVGANKNIKIIQSKIEPSESVILIGSNAYLVKFDTAEKKMDVYETIDLTKILGFKFSSNVKWSYDKIVDFQIIDKRIMAGLVYFADVTKTGKAYNIELFYKQTDGVYKK